MDLDNILYIVIAIVLAIINGVAQKKKKEAERLKQSQKIKPSFDPFITGNEEPNFQEKEFKVSNIEDVLSELNRKLNFEEEYVAKTTEAQPVEDKLDSPLSSIDKAVAPSYTPIDVPENAAFNPVDTYVSAEDSSEIISDYTFDFEEESIASTAITDALSADDEQLASLEKRSEILKDFNPKLAVVYSEIMFRKY